MTPSTVVYDVSHIRRHRAGIGRLATTQLHGLLENDSQRTYVLCGWGSDLDVATIRALQRPRVRLALKEVPGFFKRMYWNYLRIPPLDTFVGSFDIFHASEPLLPPLPKHAKAVVGFNDSAYYKFPQFYNPATARKWDFLYRRALRRADAVLVLSENTKADLVEMIGFAPERVHVVRPPTDPMFFRKTSPADEDIVRKKFSLPEQFILFVGTLEPRKNIPRLVRSFELLCHSVKEPLSLVIVGRKGWLYEGILSTIRASAARERIRLLDYVDDTDLVVLYRLAMMFVFPSLYEGHGYPVVEAMVSGTPVITSDTSSLREIGAGAAMLVDPEHPEQIFKAMLELYQNPRLREQLSIKGKARAAEFTVEKAARAILGVYEHLGC